MRLLFAILLVTFVTITVYDASALCISPHCYAITTTGTTTIGSNYQGLRYNIEIPDLYIDEQACEEMGAVVTGWIHLESKGPNRPQWIENGVTVGWIDQDGGYCVTTESAYYAYSIVDEQAERIYVEDITDPHGDTIGIEKRFAMEKNDSGLWDLYYGDIASLGSPIEPSPLDFGIDLATGIDFGAEGTISPVSQYSTIPSTRITDAQYKNDNTWVDVPTNTQTRETSNEGYFVDVCASGTFGVGAVRDVDCRFIATPNTAPTLDTNHNQIVNGPPITIPITATDADYDYITFDLASTPTLGIFEVSQLDSTTLTSSQIKYIPRNTGLDSFTYTVTDGRLGHTITGTVFIDVQSITDTGSGIVDTFDNGLGFWSIIEDRQDPPDTHDYDTWQIVPGLEFDRREGNVVRSRDCDVACVMTFNEIDISGFDKPRLKFDRWLDNSLDDDRPPNDFVIVEVYDGRIWNQIALWDSEDTDFDGNWHTELYDVSAWADDDFSVRFIAQENGSQEDVVIDNFSIYDLSAPSKITDLVASVDSSSTVIISWSIPFNGGSDISGYNIQRQANSGSFVTIQSNYGTHTTDTYTDNTISDDTQYTYRIQAKNSEGTGEYSNYSTVTIPLGPRAPIIESINDITLSANESHSQSIFVSDENGDAIRFGISGPDFVTLSKVSNIQATLFVNPQPDDVGVHAITVNAMDAALSDNKRFTVTVTLVDDPPIVTISSPSVNNETFDDSGNITFRASSTDDVDGDISDGISWSSNIDGTLGTGSFLSVTPSIGIHTITATSTDSAENESTDTISVTIQNIQEDISSSTGTGVTSFVTNSGYFTAISAIPESTLPSTGKPNVIFPDGLFSWSVSGLDNGDTITVTMTLPNNATVNSQYWKIIENTWVDASSLMGSNNDGDDTITLTITDGSSFDADRMINGHITDPGGIAIPVISTNNPPDAVNDVIVQQATQGVPFTISADTLLSNDSDADSNDVITMQSVNSTSANSGTVTLSGNIITYTSSDSFTGDDTFSYHITDGTDTDSATVTVTVIEQQPIAPDGTFVYVIDNHAKNLTKFDGTGNYISTITGFLIPSDVVSVGTGNVYVADGSWHRIEKYNSENTLTQTIIQGIGTTESLNDLSTLYGPTGIDVEQSTGNIYTVSWGGFVQKWDSAGNHITHWGINGSGTGEFYHPGGIATDSTGMVYVADKLNHRIQTFDGAGNFVSILGGQGRTDGLFDWPSDVSVDESDNLYVADSYNSRVQKFDKMGNHLQTIKMPSEQTPLHWVSAVDTDDEGNIYVADSRNYRIVKFDGNGEFITSWTYGSFELITGIAVVG